MANATTATEGNRRAITSNDLPEKQKELWQRRLDAIAKIREGQSEIAKIDNQLLEAGYDILTHECW